MSLSHDFFLLFFCLIKHLATPQIYLVTLRKGLMPRVRSTGLDKESSSLTFGCSCRIFFLTCIVTLHIFHIHPPS